MKKLIAILPLLLLFFGCSGSSIKINPGGESVEVYNMFGKKPVRDFYYPFDISDSLTVKWDGEANGGFTQNSVIFFKDYIFVSDLSGRITCFDLNTGKIKGQLKHSGAIFTTPVINKYNIIYIESLEEENKSILHIYNFLEAKQIASTEFEGRVQTEILMFDNKILFVTDKGKVYKFSHIGDMYWVKNIDAGVYSSPVTDNQNLYVATTKRDLLKISTEDGKILYRTKTGTLLTSGLTLAGNEIAAGDEDGNFYLLNKNDGAIINKYKTGFKIMSVPVIQNNTAYITNLGGDILSLNLLNFKENWKVNTGGVNNVTPLLTNNYLIVPDMTGKLIFIDVADGHTTNIYNLPNRAKLSPVIRGNLLFTGYDRGVVRAYEIL